MLAEQSLLKAISHQISTDIVSALLDVCEAAPLQLLLSAKKHLRPQTSANETWWKRVHGVHFIG